ncbi:MAG: sulfite exporter TauE/SafE family protein [Phycisphaerae bacterium]
MEFTATEALMLMLLGLMAGWVGGLVGIAGSLIMIPGMGMIFGGDRFHLHQAAAMLVNVFVVAPAVWQHVKARAVRTEVVRWTIPAAITGAVLGVIVANLGVFRGPGQGRLQMLFAAFLIYVIAFNIRRLMGRRSTDAAETRGSGILPECDGRDARTTRGLEGESTSAEMGSSANLPEDAGRDAGATCSPWALTLLVGLPTGGLGGLLGIGGGLIAVPAQQALLRIDLRQAIANSAATIVWSAGVAAIVKSATLPVHGESFLNAARLAVLLIPGALIGGWLGGGMVHRLPTRLLRIVLIIFLAYAAVRLTRSGWDNVSSVKGSITKTARCFRAWEESRPPSKRGCGANAVPELVEGRSLSLSKGGAATGFTDRWFDRLKARTVPPGARRQRSL